MEEIIEEVEHCSMLCDDHVFLQTDWSHLLKKNDASKWKDVECDDIKMHINKAKMKYLVSWIKKH